MFEAHGHRGVVLCGHRVAARLGQWSLAASLETLSPTPRVHVRARLTGETSWWMTQRPLTLALEIGAREWWIWSDGAEVMANGGRLTMVVEGPPNIEQGGQYASALRVT